MAEKATGRWSKEETDALLKAWEEVRGRRVQGEGDVWVPPDERPLLCRSRDLCPVDWRALASTVNSWRANNKDLGIKHKHRTPEQCQCRIKNLKARYFNERCKPAPSQWYFFAKLDAIFAEPNPRAEDEERAGAADGRVDDGGAAAAAAGDCGGAAADGGFVPAAGVLGGAHGVGRIPKRPRSAGPAAFGVEASCGDAAADGVRAAVETLLGMRGAAVGAQPRRGGSSSVILSTAAAVVIKGLEVIMASIEVERERDAADAAKDEAAGAFP